MAKLKLMYTVYDEGVYLKEKNEIHESPVESDRYNDAFDRLFANGRRKVVVVNEGSPKEIMKNYVDEILENGGEIKHIKYKDGYDDFGGAYICVHGKVIPSLRVEVKPRKFEGSDIASLIE